MVRFGTKILNNNSNNNNTRDGVSAESIAAGKGYSRIITMIIMILGMDYLRNL